MRVHSSVLLLLIPFILLFRFSAAHADCCFRITFVSYPSPPSGQVGNCTYICANQHLAFCKEYDLENCPDGSKTKICFTSDSNQIQRLECQDSGPCSAGWSTVGCDDYWPGPSDFHCFNLWGKGNGAKNNCPCTQETSCNQLVQSEVNRMNADISDWGAGNTIETNIYKKGYCDCELGCAILDC